MPGNGGFFAGPLTGIGPDRGKPYPARHRQAQELFPCHSFRLAAAAPFLDLGKNGENGRKWRKMAESAFALFPDEVTPRGGSRRTPETQWRLTICRI